jgi:hypothetical protein
VTLTSLAGLHSSLDDCHHQNPGWTDDFRLCQTAASQGREDRHVGRIRHQALIAVCLDE